MSSLSNFSKFFIYDASRYLKVFYLQNKDQAYGTHIENGKETYRHIGKENSILINSIKNGMARQEE